MTNLCGIKSDMLTEAWPSVEPLIVKACAGSNGRFTPGDIARAIAERDFQLWCAVNDDREVKALALTRLMRFPQLLACETLACVGENLSDWIGHVASIEAWAKQMGAKQSHLIARPGWAKIMKAHGYEETHRLLEKSL